LFSDDYALLVDVEKLGQHAASYSRMITQKLALGSPPCGRNHC
jgi:hypothetical protein